MYWVTVTMLGIAHFIFHKSGALDRLLKKKDPAGDPASFQKDPDQDLPDHDKKKSDNDPPLDGEKSLETESGPWERHLLYLQKIEATYRGRKASKDDRTKAIALSRQYLSEFPALRQAVFDRMEEQYPKVIPVFKMLAIMLDEDEAYDQAVEVCRTALENGLEDGTKTGFEGRIQRILKKRNPLNSK
jgi:hypothetical protein